MERSGVQRRGASLPAAGVRDSAEMVDLKHEALDRWANVIVIVGPLAAVVFAGWIAWGGSLHWQDLLVLAITYPLTGLGITVGYHRLFTHRSFQTAARCGRCSPCWARWRSRAR